MRDDDGVRTGAAERVFRRPALSPRPAPSTLPAPSLVVAVKDMLRIGCALLNVPQPNAKTRFGFHLPPFTSVPHLHMHCLSLPLKPGLCLKKYKYDPRCTLWFRTTQRQLKAWGVQPPFVRPEDVPPPKPGGFRN